MLSDETYMARCIQIAQLAKGWVAPNPMVGCVMVHDDKIISEGFHQQFGGPHAEVNAINAAQHKSIFSECTLYVNLEPCAHFGKTPPCADLLISHKFKRVVIGALDPHEKVAGKGMERIKNAGIPVTIGVLGKECILLNHHFFTYHQKKRPYVLLKWAQTENGFLDDAGRAASISCEETKTLVHSWRNEYQAILIGRKTAENDNPSLTVRNVSGKNPIRIVIDPHNQLSKTLSIFTDGEKTYIFNLEKDGQEGNVTYAKLKSLSPDEILRELYELNVISLLVEGGTYTLNAFLQANLWDEAKVIIGRTEFKTGTQAPILKGAPEEEIHHFGDRILTYRPA